MSYNKKLLVALFIMFIACPVITEHPAVADAAADTFESADQHHATIDDFVLHRNDYEILEEDSRVEFRVDSPIGDVWVSFRQFEGHFTLLNKGVQDYSVSIRIDTRSVDTEAGLIESMLRSESFFDVENYASLRFVGSSFEWINASEGVLKGYMTIKDVTRQVGFYVRLIDADADNAFKERVIIQASTTIKRSAFGIDSLLSTVSDNVNLFLSISALRKNTAVSTR